MKADFLHLRDSRNYILKMPRRKKVGPLYIRGGGNVRIIGGYMSTRVQGPNINISDDRGTRDGRIVHIEGLLINGSSGVPSDGIKIKAPHTIVQLERDAHRRPARLAERLPRRRGAAGRRRQGAADRRPDRLQPLQQLLSAPRDEPAGAARSAR